MVHVHPLPCMRILTGHGHLRQVHVPQYNRCNTFPDEYCLHRDGLLRGELEACLMFAPPSELLVAQPMSSPSQKLLGSYVTQNRRLRSESVARSKYTDERALAAVTAFYSGSGEAIAAACPRHSAGVGYNPLHSCRQHDACRVPFSVFVVNALTFVLHCAP